MDADSARFNASCLRPSNHPTPAAPIAIGIANAATCVKPIPMVFSKLVSQALSASPPIDDGVDKILRLVFFFKRDHGEQDFAHRSCQR
jgi:hypothetical protein